MCIFAAEYHVLLTKQVTIMKKWLFMMLIASTGLLMACSSSDSDDGGSDTDPVEGPSFPMGDFVDKFFNISGANFMTGGMPKSSPNAAKLAGITMNDRSLANGSNFITIKSNVAYKMFFVGLKGVGNYFSVKAVPSGSSLPSGGGGFPGGGTFPGTRTGEAFTYVIPLTFGPDFSENCSIIIKGQWEDGDISEAYVQEVKFEESMDGDLTINLTFDKPKDLDLHLLTPSGNHIYWNKRTWVATLPDGTTVEYGLDHDSNPACRLDYLNNENIVIPEAAVEPGVYQVYLQMYQNCDKSIGTDLNWQLVVRYKGSLVQNQLPQRTPGENSMAWTDGYTTVESGSSPYNPVWGCYPYDHAGSTDVYVMDFVVLNSPARGKVAATHKCIYEPTFMDKIKQLDLEEGIH